MGDILYIYIYILIMCKLRLILYHMYTELINLAFISRNGRIAIMLNQIVILFTVIIAIVASSYGFTLSGPHRLQHRMALTATADLHEPIVNLFNQFQHVDVVGSLRTSILMADEDSAAAVEKVADAAGQVSLYSKVDKTGFIGGIASVIETVITFFHETLQKVGLKNSYGVSIIFFTMLGMWSL
jgi:hypothetical protein